MENRRSLGYHSKWQYDMAEVELFDWSYSEPEKKFMVLKHMWQRTIFKLSISMQTNTKTNTHKIKENRKFFKNGRLLHVVRVDPNVRFQYR